MSKNIKQVYDTNPSTTLADDTLIYGGDSPYGVTDDTAITYANLKTQIQTTPTVVAPEIIQDPAGGNAFGSAPANTQLIIEGSYTSGTTDNIYATQFFSVDRNISRGTFIGTRRDSATTISGVLGHWIGGTKARCVGWFGASGNPNASFLEFYPTAGTITLTSGGAISGFTSVSTTALTASGAASIGSATVNGITTTGAPTNTQVIIGGNAGSGLPAAGLYTRQLFSIYNSATQGPYIGAGYDTIDFYGVLGCWAGVDEQTIKWYPMSGASVNVLNITTASGSVTLPRTATGTIATSANNLSAFSATTSAQLAGVISDETGTGALVFANTPTLVTPVLGVATATSINRVNITQPATAATLTIANNGSLITSGAFAITLTCTAATNVTLPTSGTLTTLATVLSTANTYTRAQASAYVTLTDAATVAIDSSLGNNFNLTLGGNRTLGVPTNMVAGRSGVINVRQDITGSRTLAYSWVYQFPAGSAPVLSTAALTFDQLNYVINNFSTATVTVTIATPAVMTWTAHGLVSGQRIQLTTTGALPTGLTANTTYWVTVVDANTFRLSTSLANARTATFIATSGTQSGVHTATCASITVTINPGIA